MKTGETKSIDHQPKTLLEAVHDFSDFDTAHNFFVRLRWPDGVVCPQCGSHDVRYVADYRHFRCSHSHQFTVKNSTVMHHSALGLDKWAVGFWLAANPQHLRTTRELGRIMGITQKSAWLMLKRLRLAMQANKLERLSRGVKINKAFVHGLSKRIQSIETQSTGSRRQRRSAVKQKRKPARHAVLNSRP